MKRIISFSVMFCLIFIISIKAASNMSDLETQKERFSLAIITHDQDEFTRLMSENNNLFEEKFIPGTSALHLAAHYVNFPAFVTLANQGLPVNYHDENRHTPLHELVKQPTPLLVELLADKKKSDYSSEELVTLSENLLESNSLKIMSLILQRNPSSINDQNSLGRTAMHYVAMLDDTEYATTLRQALLRYKPNLEMIDEFNKTAFDYAISNRNISAVKDLLKAGFKFYMKESTLLNLLKKENQTKQDLSQLLFDNVNVVPLSVLQIMIDNGADVNAKNMFGMTVLMYTNSVEVAKALLEAGADVNASNKDDGITALHCAMHFSSNSKIVRALLEAGANVNARNKDGITALHCAMHFSSNSEIVRALLEAGADVDTQDEDGITALLRAVINLPYSLEVIETLLEAGADVNARNKDGMTALMNAAEYNNSKIVRTLLEAGADVNARNKDGKTALMDAARYNNSEIVRALLEAGADPNASDSNGETALDIARRLDRQETITLLEPHNTNRSQCCCQ